MRSVTAGIDARTNLHPYSRIRRRQRFIYLFFGKKCAERITGRGEKAAGRIRCNRLVPQCDNASRAIRITKVRMRVIDAGVYGTEECAASGQILRGGACLLQRRNT